ncbi:MAG TPA: hypothetical protein VHX86_19430 [Tepidisphaeraceae bacterium]|nr:hypothetical protein [Tepidisphaeraceae bacterium]
MRVLFLCTGNSCRSQMAEAFLRLYAGCRYDVQSAGTDPKSSVHPLAIRVSPDLRSPDWRSIDESCPRFGAGHCERTSVEPLDLCHRPVPGLRYCRAVMDGDASRLWKFRAR